MADKAADAADGVRDAWDYWLSQHPVSVPEIIEKAAEVSFGKWLSLNADELMDRIAREVAKRVPPPAGEAR